MRVRLMVEVNIGKEVRNINELEEVVYARMRGAGKELLVKVLGRVEREALRRVGGVKIGFGESCWITRLGVVRVNKQRLRAGGKSFYPLDRYLGVERRGSEATIWVKRRGVELSCDYPYRKASDLLSREIGDLLSKSALHRWVQEAGRRYCEEEDLVWRGMIERGEVVDGGGEKRDLVVVEVDATNIASRRAAGKGEVQKSKLEVKLGGMYTGRESYGKGKHRLKEKVVYGGLEGAEEFGEKLWLKGEKKLRVSEARKQLLIGDGDVWIKQIRQANFPYASYQVDWWHLTRKIREAMRKNEGLSRLLIRRLYEGKGATLVGLLERKTDGLTEEREEVDKLLGYLKHNQEGFYGSNALKGEIKNKVGSGAIEKNIELVVGRRFKKWGMTWSKPGAHYLLKLRLLKYDPEAWDEFWNN